MLSMASRTLMASWMEPDPTMASFPTTPRHHFKYCAGATNYHRCLCTLPLWMTSHHSQRTSAPSQPALVQERELHLVPRVQPRMKMVRTKKTTPFNDGLSSSCSSNHSIILMFLCTFTKIPLKSRNTVYWKLL